MIRTSIDILPISCRQLTSQGCKRRCQCLGNVKCPCTQTAAMRLVPILNKALDDYSTGHKSKHDAIPKSRIFTNIQAQRSLHFEALVLAFQVHQATLHVSNSSPFFLRSFRSFYHNYSSPRSHLQLCARVKSTLFKVFDFNQKAVGCPPVRFQFQQARQLYT